MSAEACQREAARALLTCGVQVRSRGNVEEAPAMEELIPRTSPAPNMGVIPGMCISVLTKPDAGGGGARKAASFP